MSDSAQVGRYQVLTASLDDNGDERLLALDTATGRLHRGWYEKTNEHPYKVFAWYPLPSIPKGESNGG